MQTEFLREVNRVLLGALERSPQDRPLYLDRACQGKGAVRYEVEQLLSKELEAMPSVDQAAFDLFREAPEMLAEGQHLGPYQVQRKIGSGGTGAVYLATRNDGEFEKQVSVKVLKRGMDTDEIVRRFHQESRILANLDHPNISRWYESGATPDHRPYLVMEFVNGEPIDLYCRTRGLDIHERLELFLKVCAAVQFAHQHLIIHRDLKPSNILVTQDGEPKLLDFGIAKILHPDANEAPTLTVRDLRPLTPAYASPEHVLALPMTTASDVYSLGVVLYELLTEKRPYKVRSPLETDIREAVCDREPVKPSTAVTRPGALKGARVRRLKRRLSGDLDKIVLMALSKRPQDRYPSVEQFALDLRRHLDGLPISAHTGSFVYRAGKFLRRHARTVALVAAVMLVLGSLLFEREHRRAEEKERAIQVTAFLENMFNADSIDKPRSQVTMLDLLDHGSQKIRDQKWGQPGFQADVMTILGNGYRSLGYNGNARPLLERALELRRQAYSDNHLLVADSLDYLAALEVGEGRFKAAETLRHESLALRERLLGPDHRDIARGRHALGMALLDQGRYHEAEPLIRRALTDLTRLEGQETHAVSAIHGNLAILLYLRGRYDEAIEAFRFAIELSAKVLGESHTQVWANQQNLATTLRDRGDFEASEKIYRRLMAGHLQEFGDRHPAMENLKHNLGMLMLLKGELAEAEELLLSALDLGLELSDEGNPQLGKLRLGEARLFLAKGQLPQAEASARRALRILREGFPLGHWRTHEAESTLGEALLRQGRYDEAESLLVESYHALASWIAPDGRATREALQRVIELYDAWERPQKAAEYRRLRMPLG